MLMAKRVRISLANKCQLLFGAAVILILAAALGVVSHPMRKMVESGPRNRGRDIAELWLDGQIQIGPALTAIADVAPPLTPGVGRTLALIEKEDFDLAASADRFLSQAIERFAALPAVEDWFTVAEDAAGQTYYRYARAIRESEMVRLGVRSSGGPDPGRETAALVDPLERVLLIDLRDPGAASQQMINRIYIVAAGIFAGLLAIGVFWFITTRIILSPVRLLRDYAAKVSEGDINIRSDINTGDEFEQLSQMFNAMLENLKSNQDQLRSVNKGLDLKLGELAESNVALYEADKIKGEFLANVSHELRTPLHSIIGFAEVLQETLADRTGPVDEKRKRYAQNIIHSSGRLLDLITDLLDLAKIEAGRLDLHVGPVSIADTSEGLINLMRPQAEKRGIALDLKVEPNLPVVETDAGRLQQILFNFLANAVKFTPRGGRITLTAAQLPPGESASGLGTDEAPRIRFSVNDTGPGIALADQDRIFEKFVQLDPSVTKEHGGTGLGLTISRELAEMLQGQIELDSDFDRGATFSLFIPIVLEFRSVPLMPDLVDSPARRSASVN